MSGSMSDSERGPWWSTGRRALPPYRGWRASSLRWPFDVHGVRIHRDIEDAVAGEVIAVDRIPCDGRVARYSVIDVTEVEAQKLQHVGDVLVVCHGVFLPFYHDGFLYIYTMEGSSRAGEPVSRPSASFSEAARDA